MLLKQKSEDQLTSPTHSWRLRKSILVMKVLLTKEDCNVPQGYCQAPELDRACFEVPLGEICGPIESEYGYHLLLVVECTNCKAIDGEFTKIVRGDDGNSKKFATGDGFDSRGFATDDGFDSRGSLSHLATQQIRFWVGVSLAGGIVANISAKAANVVDQHLE